MDSPFSTSADIPAESGRCTVKKINGIGPKANQKLATLGITTIADLAQADPGFPAGALRPQLWRLAA